MPKPEWRYLELDAAHYWRLRPEQFDACSPREKAEMIAFSWVKREIEQYHYDKTMQASKAEK